ncbi:NAD-dependent epimerase/dehydratase family protein [Croceiramulus getboli]|nr:SDR family NAD(P)-dependent oxidoreductase [Flavobacteriaceae bacterium YJPT1-3]
MNVLVTGAAGFIGSHCAERLSKMGYDVTGVDNFSPYYDTALKHLNAKELKDKGIPIITMDLRDEKAYERLPQHFHFIFHFAAQPGIAASSTFEDYLMNNLMATKQLIDFAKRCTELKLFVNIATSSIYGLEATFTEETAPEPASFYGVTKLAAEQLVLAQSRDRTMKACSLRLYSVYGPRERPEKLYTRLISCAFFKEAFPLYEGSLVHRRSFTYVSDIIDGVVSVMDEVDTVDGEVFNLGTEEEHTTQEGIQAVEELLQTNIKIDLQPKRPGDQMRTKANIDKARDLLNYEPRVDLKEGLAKQISWFKKHFVD